MQAATAPRRAPSAEGLLDGRPIEQLLSYGEDRALTGTLVFSQEHSHIAAVVYREGSVARISTKAPLHLGPILYEHGFLDSEALNRGLAELARPGRDPKILFGDVLRQKALISPDLLAIGLAEQITRKLTSLFTLPAATRFAYYADEDLLEGFGRPDVTTTVGRAVVRGLRDHLVSSRAHEALARVGERPLVLAGYDPTRGSFGLIEGLADLELTREETEVAGRLTEPRALGAFDLSRPNGLEVRVLYSLLLLRRARIAATSVSTQAMATASYRFRAPVALRTPSGEVGISGTRPRVAERFDYRREPDDRLGRPPAHESVRIAVPRLPTPGGVSRASEPRVPTPGPMPRASEPRLPTPSHSKVIADEPRIDVGEPTLARLKAKNLIRRAEFGAALRIAEELRRREAPKVDPELETLYGFALAHMTNDGAKLEEARTALTRGVDLAPRSGEALYRFALFERKQGRLADALRFLKEAVQVDPHHIEAVRELRLFHMRVEKGMDVSRAMSPPGGMAAVRDPRKDD